MELSKRLTAIADMVRQGNRLADIGTDHGYLPIELVRRGQIPSAIAMDINDGPLMRAREHITQYGLEEKIQTRKSNGFENLKPGEADTAVIAGMGGLLMIRILKEHMETARCLSQLVLSPQSEIGEVRRFLLEQGFKISEERMLQEDGKYYVIMDAACPAVKKPETCSTDTADRRKAEAAAELADWTEEEIRYGKALIRRGDPVFLQYLKKEETTARDIVSRLDEAGTETAQKRTKEIRHTLELLEKAILATQKTGKNAEGGQGVQKPKDGSEAEESL